MFCDSVTNLEEFNQAVHFWHNQGVLLRYDDPALRNYYFLDPSWLCRTLAKVVQPPLDYIKGEPATMFFKF